MSHERQFRLALWVVGLMSVLPFLSFRHQLPIPSFYGEWISAALGLAGMAILLRKEIWQPFELPRIALLPLGLVGLILLQFLFGKIVFSQQALLGMLYLLWAMLLMVVGNRLRGALGWELFATTLAWFLVVGGLLNAVITLMQLAGWQWVMLVPRRIVSSYGNLGQPNHFADYMALGLASWIYLHAKGRLGWPVFIAVAALFVGLLALSGSRSSWLYLLGLVFLAGVLAKTDGRRRLLTICVLLLPAFLVIQQLIPMLPAPADGGAYTMPNERLFREIGGAEARLQIWHQAWMMFLGAPWLGVGFGQFDWNSFVLIDQMQGGFIEPTEHAHNLLLHLLAEMGLFAGLLCLGMLVGWLVRRSRAAFDMEWWWVMALLAVIGIHSMLEYPLWYAYFLGVAAVLLGAGEQAVMRLELARIGRPAMMAMLLLGTVGLVNLAQAYGLVEYWMQRGLQGQVKDDDLPAITGDLMRVHNESLLSPYVELVFAASIEPTRQMLDEKLQLSQSAMRFSPIRQVVYRDAVLLALKGDRAAALLQLHRAMRAYPTDIPQFARELQLLIAKSPGTYEFMLNEIAAKTKE